MNGLDKIMRLEDFHEKDNQYSCLFTGYLSSRNSFVERWRSLKKSGKLTNEILIIERIIYCYSFEILLVQGLYYGSKWDIIFLM